MNIWKICHKAQLKAILCSLTQKSLPESNTVIKEINSKPLENNNEDFTSKDFFLITTLKQKGPDFNENGNLNKLRRVLAYFRTFSNSEIHKESRFHNHGRSIIDSVQQLFIPK